MNALKDGWVEEEEERRREYARQRRWTKGQRSGFLQELPLRSQHGIISLGEEPHWAGTMQIILLCKYLNAKGAMKNFQDKRFFFNHLAILIKTEKFLNTVEYIN